jgi:hypothetical protein
MSSTMQQSGIKRTDLQRHDLSVPGRELIRKGQAAARDTGSRT